MIIVAFGSLAALLFGVMLVYFGIAQVFHRHFSPGSVFLGIGLLLLAYEYLAGVVLWQEYGPIIDQHFNAWQIRHGF